MLSETEEEEASMSDSSNGYELSVTTWIDAPVDQVWQVMTERQPE